MIKLIKFILALQFGLGVIWLIGNFNKIPLASLIVFLLNLILVFLLWLGIDFVGKNPEDQTTKKKINFLRWFLLFYFSIFPEELGIVISFSLRFIADSWLANNYHTAGFIIKFLMEILIKASTFLGPLLAIPLLYLISKAFKFKNPKKVTAIVTFLWIVFTVLTSSGSLFPKIPKIFNNQ